MKPTLLILAAGMASRYGSMKQVQEFGPSGETIMDYSIYDAIQSGFKKVVFIIRKDFADDFKKVFEPKWKDKVETAYVFQDKADFLNGYAMPAERTKPWGTAHAVLCAKSAIQDPFAVINADDPRGRKLAESLSENVRMITYTLQGRAGTDLEAHDLEYNASGTSGVSTCQSGVRSSPRRYITVFASGLASYARAKPSFFVSSCPGTRSIRTSCGSNTARTW